MIINVSGRNYTTPELLMYWIQERYLILTKKDWGKPRPWSDDAVFQKTYFCNVHRENDKVTRWIREFYSRYCGDDLFEYNIVLSRFLNWPDTLGKIGYQSYHRPAALLEDLEDMAELGKIWGGAYVITTHGIPMPKATYLCQNVLEGLFRRLEELRNGCRAGSCTIASRVLQRFEGLGSFLAAQVVADLKNTPGHPLNTAEDRSTFVEPGPGSVRGAAWFHYGEPNGVGVGSFLSHFKLIREYVDAHWPEDVPVVDNQDLQNCLCEFDKYCRVSTGSGRSKRGYNGTVHS